MLELINAIVFYIIPLTQINNAISDPLYDILYYPLFTIIFCKILLFVYYCYFIKKYKQYHVIHKKIIMILLLTIGSKISIISGIPNVIEVYNGQYIYIFRWAEWISTIYLMMHINLDTSKSIEHNCIYKINIIAQVLCILFGFISLFTYFWFFNILSTLFHVYILYVIYKTKNMFLIFFEGISMLIIYYYFMYMTGQITAINYHMSIWICELLIKGKLVIMTTMNYMMTKDFLISEYINREQIFYIIHDLRIHLNNIRLGLSQLESNEITKIMNISIDSMINMINQILVFNKIHKNEIQLNKNFFSIHKLLNQVIEEFSLQLSQHKIILEININENIYIYADKMWIRKMIVNLFSNALKYAKHKITININFKFVDEDRKIMTFSIKDDGCGVPQNFIHNLFQPFSQSSQSENSSGLGLYLTERVVTAHKGIINYIYDNGAVFESKIEVICKKEHDDIPEKHDNYLKLKNFHHKTIKKIMLVDDSPLNRQLLKRVLMEMHDYQIIEANNGQTTIELYEQHKDIDLIFMDYHMPSMTGKETINILNANGYDKNIILLTGLMKEELYRTINVNYIMIKPIHKELIKTVFENECIIFDNDLDV